jgi:AraC family transcriptional regulator, glycine betaine-responsive activator
MLYRHMVMASSETPVRIAFYLVPEFSMMAFAAAIEPLRSANRALGHSLFTWTLLSADGAAVKASNGIPVAVEGALDALGHAKSDMLIVCAGLETHVRQHPNVYHHLRRLSRHGVRVGAISSGSFILADAGLLGARRCTVHWEYLDAFRARFPQLTVSQELYVIDRDVFTCCGGTAALDMMLHFVAEAGGAELALSVAEQFIHPHIRGQEDHQRLELHARYGIDNPKLIHAIGLMEGALDDPIDMTEMARRANVSARQLERLFREHLKVSPKAFYLRLRLTRARTLLRHTLSPLRTVALECGFESTSHFCHAYKRVHGIPPTHERRSTGGAGRQPALPRAPIGRERGKAAQAQSG